MLALFVALLVAGSPTSEGARPDAPDASAAVAAPLEPAPEAAKASADWFADPNGSRYLMALSALPVRAGQGYVSAKEVVGLVGGVGVTDWLSLRVGTVPLMVPAFGWRTPSLISLRAARPVTRTIHVAAGGGLTMIPPLCATWCDSTTSAFGFVSTTLTFGPSHLTFTGGANLAGEGVESTLGRQHVIAFGVVAGNYRFAEHFSLVSETWVTPQFGVVSPSLALRIFNRHFAADLGALVIGRHSYWVPLPYLDVSWNFGA